MYNDYPTAGYSSNVDQFIFLKIGLIVLAVIIVLISLIGGMKVFKKANHNGIAAFIPFYHLIMLIEICNLPAMYFLFLFIPIANFIFYYKICEKLTRLFKKQDRFKYGLFLLPIIYFPILGFGKSEYAGINIAGMESKNQISKIDIIDDNKTKEIEVEENIEEDYNTRDSDISLGGGKYQKDYASNLGVVEEEKVIVHTGKRKRNPKPVIENPTFITQTLPEDEGITQEELNENKTTNDLFNVAYIEEPKQEEPVVNNESSIEYIICPKCGTKLAKGTEICFTCGSRIE